MSLDLQSPESTSAAAILVLAVLQGVTEFLPVSSSGHLVLARGALDVQQVGLALDVALHVGTLAAVAWAYRRDVRRLLVDAAHGRFQMLLWLVAATLPVGVVGILAKDYLESGAQTTTVAAYGLLFTALVLLAGEWGRRRAGADAETTDPDEDPRTRTPRWSDAWILGAVQVFALVPGISRSGVTIAAGMLRGLPPVEAARLSFLMSLPAISGAAVVSLPDAVSDGFGGLPTGLVLGAMVLSGLVGWAALRTLVLVLSRGAFRWFAAYCALLGGLALIFA